MSFKDILVPVLDVDEDEPALKAAEVVAALPNARVTAIYLEIEPDPVAADGYICGDIWDRITEDLATAARVTAQALQQRPWSRRIAMRELRTRPSFIGDDLGAVLRCSDLAVMLRLGGGDDNAIRSTLFDGRPVLLAPPEWRDQIGRRIFVAWNGKRESARALADAAPFIDAAASVVIATVAAHETTGVASAEAAAEHLSHRGVHVEAIVPKAGDEPATLLQAAADADADLIVMGGYGHARATEFVFGGMTRTLSRISPIPLLLSH